MRKHDSKFRNMLRVEDASEITGYHPVYLLKKARDYEKGSTGIYSVKDHKGRRFFREEDLSQYIDTLLERRKARRGAA